MKLVLRHGRRSLPLLDKFAELMELELFIV